ncbi:glycosyltransferase family 2 protein [Paenibacillus piri]|uniref:Glycosyltransferase family 2 protein n=1 Tax=Paenibacillus piri TaxID=2547395 RepID=A0A4R5KNP5_9BACL|nr:glycosyltransferase family 2 protein [Paenibacillus piri]TDF96220.1 glycosyltransferase family 2 protein [Paenibacillus piri]
MNSISIHIVTYNSEPYIQDCLEAVMAQSYPIDSVIVIDNNSNDRTEEMLNPYIDRITYIANKSNVGFAAAHNQAIRLSQCDYYLILNPDVKLHPDYVFNLIKQFKNDPSIGSATGKLLFKQSPSIVDSTGLIINKARRAFDRGAGGHSEDWDISIYVFGVSGAAALYSRSMVEDISVNGCFFDEDFFAYKEDVDIAWRSQIYGWKAYYCSDAIAHHDRGWKKGARSHIPLFIRKHSYINRYMMMIKNESIAYLFKHCMPIILYEGMSFIFFLLKEPKVLTAWLDFFKHFKKLIEKRKIIQQARKVEFSEVYMFFK